MLLHLEGDNTLLDESVLNDDIMDDDELNEELDDEASHDIDFGHDDVLKTPPDSIKSKSPESTNQSSDANTKKVILKRKLNIVVPPDAPSTDEVASPVPLEKTRKFTVTSPTAAATTDRTITISNTDQTNDDDKKVVKLSQLSAKERLELRAKKFGAPVATESLKAARSERFGLTPVTTSATDAKTESNTNTNSGVKNGSGSVSNVDVLKKRAERFGGSVSKEMNKIENLEKLQKRSERFGKSDENKATVTGGSSVATSEQLAEKARQRLERFKTSV